jgi:hypothetical protein
MTKVWIVIGKITVVAIIFSFMVARFERNARRLESYDDPWISPHKWSRDLIDEREEAEREDWCAKQLADMQREEERVRAEADDLREIHRLRLAMEDERMRRERKHAETYKQWWGQDGHKR